MPYITFKFLKNIFLTVCLLAALLCLSACSEKAEEPDTTYGELQPFADTSYSSADAGQSEPALKDNEADTYIILADEKTTVNGVGAAFDNNTLTISSGGVYRITGSLTDGKIYVNSSDETGKVKLLLSDVSVSCSADAPLYIENSPEETVLILEDGSCNSFSDTPRQLPADGTEYATAAVYSKDDLQIEGGGTLNVNGNFSKGIFSKNDIDVHGGFITVNAVDDGIRGKDSVEITGGTINISCGGDGIRTSEEAEADKGKIDISGGTINIESQLDGIQATSDISITGGAVSVKSGGGAVEPSESYYDSFGFFGGGRYPEGSMYSDSDETTSSAKGIKAENSITVSAGTISVDSLDDSLHAPVVSVNGGDFQLKSSDDGIHADELVTVTSGQLSVLQSYEGIEGRVIDIDGGVITLKSSDDGFNAASSDSATAYEDAFTSFNLLNFRGNPGGMMDYDSTCNISVSSGTVIINAQGDGVDSNGSVTMTGGKMIVYGPTNGGNGALDYGGSFNISGGTLLAVGSAGMAQSVTGNGVRVLDFRADGKENTAYTVVDSSNSCLIGFTSVKSFESVVFASDRLSSDGSYSFYEGGAVTDCTDSIYGICFDGFYTAGALAATPS